MSESRPRFHLAIGVDDLSAAEAFYAGVLQCRIGRVSEKWIDFDLMGHQVTVHHCDTTREEGRNPVDGESIAVPHFGLILEWEQWEILVETPPDLRSGVRFGTDCPLPGRSRRTGNRVRARPGRQHAGVQGISKSGSGVCPALGQVKPFSPR